jgi:hypothetical protein
MALHSALTGADLHEPKGIAGASANTLYVADGAGSGAFAKIDTDNIDTGSIKNVNKYKIVLAIEDLSSTSSEAFVVFPEACTVTEITTVLSGAISSTDAVLTFTKQSVSSLGTVTIAQSGSAEGDVDSLTPASNNTFTALQYLKVAVTTATTGAEKAFITIDVTIT